MREIILKTSDAFIPISEFNSMVASINLWFEGSQFYGLLDDLRVPEIIGFGLYFKAVIEKKGR